MVSESPTLHSPPSPNTKRPKGRWWYLPRLFSALTSPPGILKNSFRHSPPPSNSAGPSLEHVSPPQNAAESAILSPISPAPGISDKEITLQNTLQNAGPRRSSSAVRPGGSRRQSSHTHGQASGPGGGVEDQQRLKWDEANLYLTEQEKNATMKIDEPKTPYAKHYDPAEDEEEIRMLDAQDIVVDELDKVRAAKGGASTSKAREEDIPGLSLGEPEEAVPERERGREKAVQVRDDEAGVDAEDREDAKHKRFEEMRKKHYEMRDVASLLGHPDEVDAMVEEEEGA